ncbi:MAG: hypothetical protein JHC33_09085 [Ignisphaera sp.]|nr:hypothetical protein [Ignisphaera sp.]
MGAAAAAVVGGGLGLVGAYMSNKSAKSAAADARNNTRNAVETLQHNSNIAQDLDSILAGYGEKGIEQAQSMLDMWESAFGSIQNNLSNYYNNLDPTRFSQEQKTAYAQNLDKQMSQFNEALSQRGITSSGQRMQLEKEAMFSKAATNAKIDISSTDQVAQMKQGWLNYGQPLQASGNSAMQAAINNQAKMAQVGKGSLMDYNRDIANAYMGQAASSRVEQANYQQSAAGFLQGTGTMIGQALGSYAAKSTPATTAGSSIVG